MDDDALARGTLHLNRAIPVPRSVSEHAQQVIAGGCASVAERLATPPTYPSLDDGAGWKARIGMMDDAVTTLFAARADAVGADVEVLTIDGIRVYAITPPGADTDDDAPILLDVHGGALVAGGGEPCRMMGTLAAVRAGLRTWSVDYRMPPDHPYPAPLDDCLTVYRAMLERHPREKLVVGGASAGGNLAAALMLKAYAEDLPMPACLLLLTPEVDLTESGDSFETNQGIDYVLVNRLSESIALYADGHELEDPFLSPLFGDVSHFPPTYLQAGTRDLFLSNTVRMHRKLRAADVDAELHIGEAMPHGGFFGFAPEDEELNVELRKFLAQHV
jgi:acetyl esterase/lipase